MNDADLGDDIDQHAADVEEQLVTNDETHLNPSRWWFASSAFPMIAGTLGPVASAFSLCALVRPWRQHYTPGTNIAKAPFYPDPNWLTIINALQLAIAVVANLFLLLNMAKRVRFSIAQPITIVGWYTSAILLVCLNSTAAGPLKKGIHPVDGYIWSQAFWYGIWAAILYFLDASFMVVTFWGAWTGRYSKDFSLTSSQRTLMLQTIVFLGYLLVGALAFSDIEGWDYLDGVYWADVTLFTIGFGDYAPTTTFGQALLMPYALIGIISLGLVIGSIRSLILERGKKRMDARMEEKKRRSVVKSMKKKGKDDLFEPIHQPTSQTPTRTGDEEGGSHANEFERRRAEFALMRKIQEKASSRRRWMAMGTSTGTIVVLWMVGALIFYETEKRYQAWGYFDGFYLCFCSLTTIGYGDVVPVSNAGKSFFVFWSLLALPAMTVLISNAGDTVIKFVKDATIGLGNITILPGELGFILSLKQVLNEVSCHQLYPSMTDSDLKSSDLESNADEPSEDEPATPYQLTTKENGSLDDRGRSSLHDVEERHSQDRPPQNRNLSTFTSKVRRSLSRLRDPMQELPSGTDFHFLLICEIQAVTKHLTEPSPRRYTYDEWAWYLRLIGEDERKPDTHRKPVTRHEEYNEDSRAEVSKWSWVGDRSPLIGSKEESEWIVEKLTERLKEALSEEGRHRARMAVAGLFGGKMRHSHQLSSDDITEETKRI